jgi:subfamily B ATP-binding cassette protein MsbA
MIAGLLPCDHGEMRIDGIDITNINVESYQKRIGYITQEPVIFNDTIFNNVTFWAPRTAENEQKCIEALQKASVHQFVSDQPLGVETQLGNNGINLSGGQKQRISIARELYKDIDILIMDEATSALDSETEKMIQENIEALKGQYTILMVAHRLSTIKNADAIVLMDNGRIKEMGNFQELIERVPRFKTMVELQEV